MARPAGPSHDLESKQAESQRSGNLTRAPAAVASTAINKSFGISFGNSFIAPLSPLAN